MVNSSYRLSYGCRYNVKIYVKLKYKLLKRFYLSNLNFGLQLVEETFEADNVVMRSRKSNSQCHRQKKKKTNTSNSRQNSIRKLQIEQQVIPISGKSSCAPKWQVVNVPPVE